jgi:beta-glucosidase
MTFLEFPEGFGWGSATSSHQVEGGNTNNDWWRFEQEGHVVDREVSGDAVDSYRRYTDDLDHARAMNHSMHRLSLEWSRIEPSEGVFDDAEVEHYIEVLKAVRARGMKTFVTLNHFTVPLWFDDRGNWPKSDSPAIFARFAEHVGARLAPYVDAWITINEPMHYVNYAFYQGKWPPRGNRYLPARLAGVHLVRAHRLACAALKKAAPEIPVGVAVNAIHIKPCDPSWLDSLGWFFDWFMNYWFLDRVRGTLDFIGTQYYMALSAPQLLTDHYGCADEGPHTDMGWRICPDGFRSQVTTTWKRYGLPIYITENGIADASDELRPTYIRDHLVQLHRAIVEDGADVRGYFYWSLLDNFEWAEGWYPKFGLIAVDRTTMERIPRPSSHYYADICARNGLDDGPLPADLLPGSADPL